MADRRQPLPLSASVLYGVGEMPITITMVLFGLFTLFFYSSVMGLPASLVGAAIFAGLVFDAVIDPYIGHLSDITRHPFGRRHIFMLPGALLLGPCFFLLFSPPRGLGQGGLFAWLMVTWLGVRVSGAIYRIPYLGMGAELTQGYDERTKLFAIRAFFGLIGTVIGAALSFLLFLPEVPGGGDAKLDYSAYPKMGLLFGAMITGTGLIGTLGTLRYRTHGSEDSPRFNQREFFLGVWLAMRMPAFRQVWLSFTIFFLAVVFNASLSVHYFTRYARVSAGGSLSGIQTTFYVGAVAGVFVWLALSRKWEKRTMYVTSTLGLSVLMVLATVVIGEGHALGAGNIVALMVGHAVAGVFASALWVIPPSMMADVVDQDELATGLRREGMYFGILNLGDKIAAGGALLLSGTLLELSGKLSPGPEKGLPADPKWIGILYGLAPAILLLGAVLSVIPYRLNRQKLDSIHQQLAERSRAAVKG